MTDISEQVGDQTAQHLLKMGNLAAESLKLAIQALRDQDVKLALKVIEQDDQLDNLQIVVEEEIERGIGTNRNPSLTTFDLRRDLAMAKIGVDLERIGDYATNIAEVVMELKDESYLKPLVHIPQMANLVMNMVNTSLKAFIEKNPDLADAVCQRDDEADNLYEEVREELIRITGQESDPRKAYQASRFLLIAEWLERAGDHATNIGEATIHIVTGKRVKY